VEVITRKDATAQDLKRFYTGEECDHGHTAERHVSTGGCVECTRVRDASPEKKEMRRLAWKKRKLLRDQLDGGHMGATAFNGHKCNFEKEGCTLLSALRGGSTYVFTYLWEEEEYSVTTSSWSQGRRPHRDVNSVPHSAIDRYKAIVNAEPECTFITMTRADCGATGAYRVVYDHTTAGKVNVHSVRFAGEQGRAKRWLPKKPRFHELYPQGCYLYLFKVDGEVVYVGKTNKPQARLDSSHERYKETDEVWLASVDNEANRNVLELYLINLWRPERNTADKADVQTTLTLPIPDFKLIDIARTKGGPA